MLAAPLAGKTHRAKWRIQMNQEQFENSYSQIKKAGDEKESISLDTISHLYNRIRHYNGMRKDA